MKLADLRYAFRSFVHTPVLAVTLVLTIGLGVGGNSALFAFIGGMAAADSTALDLTASIGRVVVLLVAASGLILFLACSTIASLLLGRARSRAHEMAVRVALGASGWALVRLCFADAVVLLVIGGAVAALFGLWASSLIPMLFFVEDAEELAMAPDAAWLLMALAGWLVVLFALSLTPALIASPRDPMRVLHREASGVSASAPRLRGWLLRTQIATCCLLLLAAAGIREDLQTTLRTVRGAEIGSVLVARVQGGESFLSSARERLLELPDVVSTAVVTSLQGGRAPTRTYVIERAQPRIREIWLDVSTLDATQFDPDMLEPIAGRAFGFRDSTSSCRVALVNETASARYFAGNAVGQSIDGLDGTSLQIIGVLPSRNENERPALYRYETPGTPPGGAQGIPFYATPLGPRETLGLDVVGASVDYFEVFADPPIEGRAFTAEDTQAECPVAVLSELAARGWDGAAVGGALIGPDGARLEVVGVVGARPLTVAQHAPRPLVFLPRHQVQQIVNFIAASVVRESPRVRGAMDETLRSVEGGQLLADTITLDEHIMRTALAAERIALALVAVCTGLALVLTIVGAYGAMNDLVVSRRAELALRTLLGASAARVIGYVVGAGLRIAVVGLGMGIGLSAITLPLLDRLVSVPRWPSPGSAALAGVVIGLLVIIACVVPAWRAVSIDPTETVQTN